MRTFTITVTCADEAVNQTLLSDAVCAVMDSEQFHVVTVVRDYAPDEEEEAPTPVLRLV